MFLRFRKYYCINEAPRRKRTGYLYVNYFPIAASGGEPACRLAGITLKIPRLNSGSQPAAGRSSTKCLLHKIKVSLI